MTGTTDKTIIVYYSLEGNTDYMAKRIAEAIGADLLRLDTKKAYPSKGFRKILVGGRSAVMAQTPALVPYAFDGDAYGRVIFGFPVWAGNVTPPLRTFIQENDLGAKRIAAFACQSGSGAETAFEKLKECLGIEAFEAEAVFIDPLKKPSEDNEQKLQEFCGTLGSGI